NKATLGDSALTVATRLATPIRKTGTRKGTTIERRVASSVTTNTGIAIKLKRSTIAVWPGPGGTTIGASATVRRRYSPQASRRAATRGTRTDGWFHVAAARMRPPVLETERLEHVRLPAWEPSARGALDAQNESVLLLEYFDGRAAVNRHEDAR